MQRLFNSLTSRLILTALLSAGLVLSLGAVGWGTITRLIATSDAISTAEGQENRLLTIQNLIHTAAEHNDQQGALLGQIELLSADFEATQDELLETYQADANDPAIAQVIATLDDTNAHWADTHSLLDAFISAPDASARIEMVDAISQTIVTTNVYANRTSESFQAVAERERRNILVTGGIIGLLTLLTVALILSLIINVVRDMGSLTRTAHAFSGGAYTVRAGTQGLAEIAELGETFNLMADSIQERETALRDANITLEQRVQQRTAELEKAMAEAREASRAKDEFLSVMSHELRTPLNAILGYQGILELAGGLKDDNLDMVQRTGANARRLLGLINDVLDISRIEAGRMEIVPSNVTIRDFVHQMQSQMNVLASEKGVEFRVMVDEHMPAVIRIDEDALTKIATNLLGNAFKFTQEGRVSLTIRPDNRVFQIEVRDTGIGIPVHLQQIIFERFRQADSSTTRSYGGSGLGLSIVQQLCTLMGGTVVVDSTPDEGSTFTVTLPLEAVVPEKAHS